MCLQVRDMALQPHLWRQSGRAVREGIGRCLAIAAIRRQVIQFQLPVSMLSSIQIKRV